MPARDDTPEVVTIRDVAAQAGVSVTTVSNYFHHPERMSATTRARIAAVVDAFDFTPNDAARKLRGGASPVVGYIAFELASARTPAIANAMGERLAAADMHLLSAVDDADPERERAFLRLFARQQVAGVIVTPISDIEPELARLRARGLPSVLSARRARSPQQPSVAVDHVLGGRRGAEHLLSTGRRRLAFVTDTLELSQIADRFEGAQSAVRDQPGASLDVMWASARSVAAGEQLARQLLSSGPRTLPDALFCVNDLVALGLSSVLARTIRIPEDLAVLGYDDIEFARLGTVPLTSVHTPQEELGTTAAELLLAEIEQGSSGRDSGPRPHVELEPHVVVRASTAT